MNRKENFFISDNKPKGITSKDYDSIKPFIDTINAVSRITYQSLYVIDYFKKNFLYVSGNPLFLCGHSQKEVNDMGFMFYLTYVIPEEQSMLLELNQKGFNFFENIPVNERIHYSISYDFHLKSEGQSTILINHKLTPVRLDSSGHIWLAICIVSLSSHKEAGHIEIRKENSSFYWEYSLKSHRWEKKECIALTEKEKEILFLSAGGYTMKEIGEILCLSTDSIKSYKRKIFEKLGVNNITEAVSYASNSQLI